MTESAQLPIRRVTFYKHGVSMVEREGRVDGEALQLGFREDDIDDALKSLTVLDRSGGQVVCVDYQIPAAARRDADALALRAGASMLDLLERLTGWRVRVELAGRVEPVEGRVTGLQYAKERRRLKGATLMLLDEQTGAVQAVPAAGVSRIVPLEARIGEELERFLDAGRRADGSQTVSLRLTPGEHDLAVSYLVPAPTWRVSYRVVAESDDGAAAGAAPSGRAPVADTGRLLLQGWGLVDNRFDEDLDNVAVSLVAGQPISFIYDLKTSRVPTRSRIGDESRVASGPVEYGSMASYALHDSAAADMDDESDGGGAMPQRHMHISACHEAASASPRAARRARIGDFESAEPASTTADQRETFAYDVLRPVSIPRGSSALVPILQATLDYRRELLFNEDKHAEHPVAALCCVNRSGLVLERGPATLVEDGRYRGEAIVPFTGKDAGLYLPYAVELGVDVRVESERSVETQRLSVGNGLLHREIAMLRAHRYEIVNRTGAAQTVTVERDIDSLPGELFETPAPAARGNGVYRWEIACPAGGTSTFTVRSRQLVSREVRLSALRHHALQEFLSEKGLTPDTRRALEALREELGRIQENEQRIEQFGAQRDRLVARQEHLRRNIGALNPTGDEGAVRLKMVRELQAAEGSLSGIDQLVTELSAENERRRKALADLVPGTMPQAA